MREVSVRESSNTEVCETIKLLWVHCFSSENFTFKVGMSVKVFEGVSSIHFFREILLSVPKPFKVLSFNLERESLMLLHRSILNFIELIKLSFENNEVSSSLRIKINNILLEFFEGIHDL